jgi:hypothetical protein
MRWLLLLVVVLLCRVPAYAVDDSVAAEIEALKRQVAEQAQRLEELSRRLAEAERRAAPAASEPAGAAPGASLGGEAEVVGDHWPPADATAPVGASLRGYAVVAYQRAEGEPDSFDQEAFAVYFNSPLSDQVSVFAEIEFSNGIRLTDPDTGDDEDVGRVKVERALIDYHPVDWAQVRLGKFLTPFGDWNVNHADPLHFTTSRPLVVGLVVPETLTGILLQGTFFPADWEVDYRLHLSNGSGEQPDTDDGNYHKAVGARLAVRPWAGLQLGASLFDDADDRYEGWHQQHFGVDFQWRPGAFQLSGEGVVSRAIGDRSDGAPEGMFVEVAYTFGHRLSPVVRYELMRLPQNAVASRVGVAGIAYRPLAPLLLKAEYQVRRGGRERWRSNAVLASVATFF